MVRAEAERRGLDVDVHVTERGGHARELAAAAGAAGAGLVIVWGGDGTFNEAGATLMGSSTAIALVPAGSGNGLAAALGVPREPAAALGVAFDGAIRTIDAGLLNGRPFFNIAGVGFDARIAKLFNERARGSRGGWPYVVIGVREGCRYRAVDYDLQLDGDRRHVRALLIAFANGKEYGIGARIAPGAELDDGWLDTAIVGECRVMARFWHARHLAMGTAHLAPNVSTVRLTHALIERDGAMEYHVDGEPGVAEGRVEIRIVPAALKVRTAQAR
jgi:YegS/Rv2252/BmrU family lipid kinase